MTNDMWHMALKLGTSRLQDIVVANLPIDDLDTIAGLLSTEHLKGKEISSNRGNYLLMYGGEYQRPYPSVIIWKFSVRGDQNIVEDMRPEDGWIIEHIWKEWLMPEDTEEEYVPPEGFVVMMKAR